MSDFDRNAAAAQYGRSVNRAGAVVVDEGLRAYMLRIYNYMALGLAITGFVALGAYTLAVTTDPTTNRILLTSFGQLIYGSPLRWVIIFAPLAVVFLFSFRIERMSPAAAQITFWVFGALMGLSLSSIFLVYTQTSIARVFFITAAAFGGLSLWGYTTQRDISGWGSFLMMGLIGIVIASLVNIFLRSDAVQFVVSVVGVLVFAGLTAWDTQRLKSEYIYGSMQGDVAEKSAIMGALSLYLNFINLFVLLLQLFGDRR